MIFFPLQLSFIAWSRPAVRLSLSLVVSLSVHVRSERSIILLSLPRVDVAQAQTFDIPLATISRSALMPLPLSYLPLQQQTFSAACRR